jgi:hypothetical protein
MKNQYKPRKDKPIHRAKAILGENKIVDRHPSSAVPVFIVFLSMCLIATYLWFDSGKHGQEIEEEYLAPVQLAQDPSAGLQEAIKRRAYEDIQGIVEDIDEASLNAVFNGMTPVMTAASVGDARIVELLLNNGANPNNRGSADRTALQYAAEKNHIAVARKLLEFGADIDACDNTRLTPLIMAADRGYTDLGIFLIESGADVNIQHVQGWTALIDAASNGNMQLVQHLLAAGADRESSTSSGWRAIDFARQNKHEDIVALLAE